MAPSSHWSVLINDLCALKGSFAKDIADIERSIDISRSYVRDLRFPTLLQELSEDVLIGAVLEADGLLQDEPDLLWHHCPAVLALAFATRCLLYGDAVDNQAAYFRGAAGMEEACRLIAPFIVIEKMRRMDVYGTLIVPFDPWDDEVLLVTDDERPERLAEFKRWLGYSTEETNE